MRERSIRRMNRSKYERECCSMRDGASSRDSDNTREENINSETNLHLSLLHNIAKPPLKKQMGNFPKFNFPHTVLPNKIKRNVFYSSLIKTFSLALNGPFLRIHFAYVSIHYH
jgi:hypothetical protein